jgi:hypothetical protein
MSCSRGPTVAGTPPPSVAPCAPWVDWGLPLDAVGLRVLACDERRLAIRAPSGTAVGLAPQWRAALEAAGWVEDLENADGNSSAGMVAVRYAGEEGDVLQLSVIDDVDHTQVVLVRAGEAP